MKNHSSNLIYIFQAEFYIFWNLYCFKHRFELIFLPPRSNTEASKTLSNKEKPMKPVTKSVMDYVIPPIMFSEKIGLAKWKSDFM